MEKNYKKHWQIFKVSWQTALEYRGDLLFNILRSSVIPFLMIFFWLALYKNQNQIGGFDFSSMVIYYLGVLLLYGNNSGYIAQVVSSQIKQGDLTNYLLKPVSYFKLTFWAILSEDLFSLLIRTFIFLLIYFFFPYQLSRITLLNFFLFCIFLVGGYILNFLLNLLLSLTAFIMVENFMFRLSFLFLMRFLNGFMIPLAFFPPVWQKILNFLPFTYQFYFPITIILGKLSLKEILKGMLIFLIIIFILYSLTTLLWRRALRYYEAIGR